MTARAVPAPLLRALVAALLAVAVVGGCSGQSRSDDADDGSDSPTSVADEEGDPSAFPITVDTPHGEVTIEEAPTDIVAVSLDAVEILLSLGIEPVAAPAAFEEGPWIDEVADRDDIFTDRIDDTDNGREHIQTLNPDLIVGSSLIADDTRYPLLADIAPTVTFADDAGDTTAGAWEEAVTLLGVVTGRSERAAEVVDDTLALIAEAADAHPVEGATVTFAGRYAADQVIAAVSDEHSGLRFLSALGLGVADLTGEGATVAGGRAELSLENLDLLDRADLVIMGDFGGDLQEDLESHSLYRSLEAVQEDRVVVLDLALTTALNTPTPLNIPPLLEELGPVLDRLDS